jgi:hypothetical protein
MSSESNGKKPESIEPAPPSGEGRRASLRAPSAWGAIRDALAAVYNLETLLKNASVPDRTILDVLPEIHSSAALLRGAFEARTMADKAIADAATYGRLRLADLDAVLAAIAAGDTDRAGLTPRLAAAADQLEASSELLALLERAGKPSVTEVGLDLVAREAGRLSTGSRGRVLRVRFDEASPDPLVTADPYVLGSLLSLVVACVNHAAVESIVVRAQPAPNAGFVVETAGDVDASLPTLAMRIMPWIPPTEAAACAIGERFGAIVELHGTMATIRLKRLYG